jgi:putative ABC transport system permease protein
MDISFVQQNAAFDFLLDRENQIIQVAPGEIGVPIYYIQERNVKMGDTVTLRRGAWEKSFTVAAFVRDAQMNPAVIHSKRFLVSAADFNAVRQQFPETEYLIEFRLTDPAQVGEFSSAYAASGLPRKGPAVDHRLFKVFNALTDGIVAGVIIVLSLLLILIAILCLRFTLLATLEEDTKEIGVMKAIGIAKEDIRRIYLAKYVVIGALAALLGYLASLSLNRALSANIMLYVGRAPKSAVQQLLPPLAVTLIFLMVLLSCTLVLRRFGRITAVAALRSGNVGESMNVRRLRLAASNIPNVNLFLGLRDILQRFKLFWLLTFVFFFAAAIILIPIHFLTTMESPTFISYMGIGRSDLRIDLRQSDNMAERFDEMIAYLAADEDVARYAPLVTAQFTRIGEDGGREALNVETGDFTLFPLNYLQGAAPQQENEIALSVLNAQEMEKEPGDTIVLLVDGEERELTVSGVYQDVTNGGRTAKAMLPYDPETALWYAVSLDLTSAAAIDEKAAEYADIFQPARVTDLEGYIAQTLGNTIGQLKQVTIVAVLVGLSISVLITSLFLNMLISKDAAQIAVMRGIGFSLRHIRQQYLARALFLLSMGVVLGTLFSNTLGQRLVSAAWSFMGASQIEFVIDPLQAYLLFPLLLLLCVSLTTLVSIRGIKENSIAQMIME